MERFNQRVVRSLAELEGSAIHKCEVIALWDTPEFGRMAPYNISLIPCSSNKVKAALAFVRSLIRMKPDIVLFGHVLLSPLSALARVLAHDARRMLFVHGVEVWDDHSYRNVQERERWAVRRCIERVISVSRFTQTRMIESFGLAPNAFYILPNAVDIDIPRLSPQIRTVSPEREYRLLTVTRLTLNDRYKGCDKVICAMPKVLRKFPNTYYCIVGEGPLRPELENLTKKLGVAAHVRFLGFLSDEQLEEVYHSSHVFVMPSTKEGFGIVFLEAWKHGLPVIAGNRDASPEVVTHGVDGLIVNPDSIDDIGDGIVQFLSDPEMAEGMGQRGFEKVIGLYTHEHFRQNFVNILLEATKRCVA